MNTGLKSTGSARVERIIDYTLQGVFCDVGRLCGISLRLAHRTGQLTLPALLLVLSK